jgi:acetylornithine deacetylase/succinyl-diaminopimelate desuccinylase-like protein
MEISSASEKLGQDGLQLIRDVCDVAWTRLPGSEGEAKAQVFLEKKLKELGAEETEVRHFKVYSKFFLWWPRISTLLFLISMVVYFFIPLLATLLSVLMVMNLVCKLFSYQFLDVFFKANPSSNVIGKLKAKSVGPLGKPKRIVIIGGHTDSNNEFPIGKKLGSKMLYIAISVFVLMGLWLLVSLIKTIVFGLQGILIISDPTAVEGIWLSPDWLWIIFACFLPYTLYVGFNMVANRPVPGANDNLSGVAVAAESLRFFAQPENRLKNVELWAVCFGSEEGGMMGSKAMAKEVKNALDNGTFPGESIWVINFDSIAANGPISIARSEPLYRVKSHDPAVIEQMVKSAEKVGVPTKVKSLEAGTDSAPFTRLGIPGVGCVCFGDGSAPANWHSMDDTPENCDVRGIINSIKVALQMIKDIDDSLD